MLKRLGAARNWIHPASIDGLYQRRHRLIGRGLIAFLLIAPWIRIDGSPLLLAELATRKVFLAGMVFTPRDSVLLLALLLGSGFLLFLVTSLWGRLWCGYACPQTVLMEELVRRIERWVEGERGARLRLDRADWTFTKVRKRFTKWGLYLLLAAGLAGSFSGFFVDAYALWSGQAPMGAYLFTASITLLMFLDFAWFREQFCHFLCPYARLQSVLTDENTVNIAYDFKRGEPRKPRGEKLGAIGAREAGACIDCNRCVAVCPSGIDIRDGYQLECIACARCVDACIDVMGKLGEPTLVKYASLTELEGRPTRKMWWRPMVYIGALAIVAIVGVASMSQRIDFDVTLAQDPRSAETATSDGRIQNLYQLTIHNNTQRAQVYEIEIDLAGAELVIPGGDLRVEPAARRVVPAFVTLPRGADVAGITPFSFVVSANGREVRHRASFRNHAPVGSK